MISSPRILGILVASIALLAAGSAWPETGTEPAAGFDPDAFQQIIARLQERRAELARQFKAARNDAARNAVRRAARSLVVDSIVREVFPAWMGTPWYMGEDDDAQFPHQAGKRISCSAFVTAVLQNVGLQLDSRVRWMQAPALYIQRSLAPQPKDLHRYPSIPPATLQTRLALLGEGLYVIGLNCHVGFVWIDSQRRPRFVHSNYVDPEQGVTEEPVSASQAIANSQDTGYWVTPLFQDDRLIDRWLTGQAVPLQKLGQRTAPAGGMRPSEPAPLPKSFWSAQLGALP
jgi:hypothetical protein